jgi:hypothetical protein
VVKFKTRDIEVEAFQNTSHTTITIVDSFGKVDGYPLFPGDWMVAYSDDLEQYTCLPNEDFIRLFEPVE